ncbi:hypothetical protein MJM99_34940, partial [Salmonella enterica subsp. enterica serovar Kentucky]|nr:hypothetical protein [Salmonella enterica subsp. enterica serovar Kentucky]
KGTLLDVFKSYARTLEEQYKMTLQEYIPLQNAVDAATYGYAEQRRPDLCGHLPVRNADERE